jgi:hypothetical protein
VCQATGAPVVANYDHSFFAERIEEADDVANQVEDGVCLDCVWAVGLTIASLIGRHGVEAGSGERRQLVSPGIPGFREAVKQHHQWAVPASAKCMRMPFVSTKRC